MLESLRTEAEEKKRCPACPDGSQHMGITMKKVVECFA